MQVGDELPRSGEPAARYFRCQAGCLESSLDGKRCKPPGTTRFVVKMPADWRGLPGRNGVPSDAGDSLLSQRPFPRWVAASVCALLAALLLLLLAAGLSGCYGCFNHVEKALSEPCFVSHKIVDARDSLLSQRSFLRLRTL